MALFFHMALFFQVGALGFVRLFLNRFGESGGVEGGLRGKYSENSRSIAPGGHYAINSVDHLQRKLVSPRIL